MTLITLEAEAMAVVDAAKPARFASADEESIWQGFRFAFQEAERTAFRTHYFSIERNWLNRSVNHVFLGLYPSSYMWGKLIPEYARFLLRRPFGLNAPLVGYAATHRLQEALIVAQDSDPEFAKTVEQMEGLTYLLTLLLPVAPLGTQFPANFAASGRHIVSDIAQGKPITGSTLQREAEDFASYQIGYLRTSGVVIDAIDALLGQAVAETGAPPWQPHY